MSGTFAEYPPLPLALEQIAGLDDRQFRVLLETVNRPNGFDRSLERCRRIASRLDNGLPPRDVFNILGTLSFLYSRLREPGVSSDDLRATLREFLEFTDLGDNLGRGQEGFERVAELISEKPSVERRREIQWLQTGVVGAAVDVEAVLDLRPRFRADFVTVEEYVPIAIFRVAVETDFGADQSYVFQMPVQGIETLRNVLDNLDAKLSTLRSDEVLGKMLLPDEPMREEDE
jgi:hypothetical protein